MCYNYNIEFNHKGQPADDRTCSRLSFIPYIHFQEGKRDDPNSIDGVTEEDLLEIVRDRLDAYLDGDLCCREFDNALNHVEEALMWLNMRTEKRIRRGVYGTMQR